MRRLLLDQGIRISTVSHFNNNDFDAVHVHSLGMSRATDRSILERARMDQRTVITSDADFHALLAVNNESGPSVIRIRRGGLHGDEIAALLQQIWPKIETRIQEGAMITVTGKAIRIRRLPLTNDIQD